MSTRSDLHFYLGYGPDAQQIIDADQWLQDNPGSHIVEWVNGMIKIGELW